MMTMTEWEMAQAFEKSWWAQVNNSFSEETKQLTYAFKMGLTASFVHGRWPCYDLGGRRILDIGGGPVSMLLKSVNVGTASMVAEPCDYPQWVQDRYAATGIGYWKIKGEDLTGRMYFDEVWIYNVLQHVEDPALIIANAKAAAPVIRIFEWIDMEPCEGHPQMLNEGDLNKWLGGEGRTEWLNENGCQGRAYHGVFASNTG